MGLKTFLGYLLTIFCVGILIFYWFIPLGVTEFQKELDDLKIGLDYGQITGNQFYPNLRYVDSEISYKIHDCPLQKRNDMEKAFEIISSSSVLNFLSVETGEEITVICDSKNKIKEGLFIAGEGGPVNITKTDNFNVIFNGRVLLIRASQCENPNVALHELLHALGFDHSEDPEDIMYPISKCGQGISENIITKINELYAISSFPDLVLNNVSAVMNGKYLNFNASVKNNGLKESGDFKLLVYADGKKIRETKLDSLDIGYEISVALNNLWVGQINIKLLDFVIELDSPELKKNNNRIRLEIK